MAGHKQICRRPGQGKIRSVAKDDVKLFLPQQLQGGIERVVKTQARNDQGSQVLGGGLVHGSNRKALKYGRPILHVHIATHGKGAQGSGQSPNFLDKSSIFGYLGQLFWQCQALHVVTGHQNKIGLFVHDFFQHATLIIACLVYLYVRDYGNFDGPG